MKKKMRVIASFIVTSFLHGSWGIVNPPFPFNGTWRLVEIRCMNIDGSIAYHRMTGKLRGDQTVLALNWPRYKQSTLYDNCLAAIAGEMQTMNSPNPWRINWLADLRTVHLCGSTGPQRGIVKIPPDITQLRREGAELVERDESHGACQGPRSYLERLYARFKPLFGIRGLATDRQFHFLQIIPVDLRFRIHADR